MTAIPFESFSQSDQKAVREELDRILKSGQFLQSRRRQRFLEYIVNETLAGRGGRLKGYNIAREVFDRPEEFDPNTNSIVRMEAGRLRDRLREYYESHGGNDHIRIELPKGTYTPQIEFRHAGAPPWPIARWAIGPRQLAVLVAAALVVVSGAWFALQWLKSPPTQVSSTVPAVAVLPFDDLSTDQNLGYFGDGVAEDIITALSRFPDLVVVARSSSFAYKGKAVDMRQVGKELGVGYVVEGSVRKEGEKIRIISQLIDTRNGEHVWAERFDRSGMDPWALQDEVTGKIVSAMTGEKGALKQAQYRQAWGKDATTLEEYDYYLRGHEEFMKFTKEGIDRSGEIWRKGLAKFPSSPLLKVKLGWYHMIRAMNFVSDDPPADIRKAGGLARQVLANEHLSPQVARLANWLMSYVLAQEKDFDGALAAADRTVALAPHDMFVLSDLMLILVQVGRPDQALQWGDQAAARDPALGWSYNYGRGWAHLVMGRFGEAANALRQTEYNDAPLLLAIAYVRLDRSADARAEVAKMMKVYPAITLQAWRLAYSFLDPAILDNCAVDLVQSGLPEADWNSFGTTLGDSQPR